MHISTSKSGTPHSLIQKNSASLREYLLRLERIRGAKEYTAEESSLQLPFDTKILTEVDRIYRETDTKRLKYIIVIGIGGSNLGAKAVYDALWGSHDTLEPERYPKMIWADTSDQSTLAKLTHTIQKNTVPEEYICIYISKSGGTSETAINGSAIWRAFGTKLDTSRWIVITDASSRLMSEAANMKLRTVTIPRSVGGRFSVFSAAGLLPLRFMTGNLPLLLEGAREMAVACMIPSVENPAIMGASAILHAKGQGLKVHDTFLFHPQLESLGKWYRQLLAESLGKEKDRDGKIVHEGILPTVSIGSTDLHSISQLYLGGPRMSFTTFISTNEKQAEKHDALPTTPWERIVPAIQNKTPSQLMTALRDGVQAAYATRDLPFLDVRWDELSLRNIGAYMQWKMIETMLMAELLGISAFDQPAVELYKSETRRILESPSN